MRVWPPYPCRCASLGRQAYVFSAWSALLGSVAFLAASVGIMHSQAGTTWSVLLCVGFVATSGGALLVIADSHIYATDPGAASLLRATVRYAISRVRASSRGRRGSEALALPRA